LTPGIRPQPFSTMPKDKRKSPATNAEDELFKRGSDKSRELLKEGRRMKRDKDRADYWARLEGK